jgi:endonuclease/exonuclease/phosphatase family metal-dependent hydrolase
MDTLRVGTLNLWNRSGPWEKRLFAIREGVRTLAPDVLGMQEVLRAHDPSLGPDQAALVAEGLGYHTTYGAAWELGGVEFGNAIVSRFPIVRTERFELPGAEEDEKRCLLFAELDAPLARVPVFVTHLAWRLHQGHVREAQVRAIADHVAAVVPVTTWRGFPPVLLGDFNAEPESDEIRFLKGLCSLRGKSVYFADAFGVAGDGSRGATFCRRNPFAAEVREPDRRLDYVFVRGPDRLGRGDPLDARVCFDQPVDGVFPSDHFGVMANLYLAG